MHLVVGATGFLGGEICRRLTTADQPVRALVRTTSDPGKVAVLERLGVEAIVGDLKDRASLEAACRGVQAVFSTASSTLSRQSGDSIESVDLQGQLDLIGAAEAAGVAQFVYVSFPELPGSFPLQTAKRTVEQRIRAAGFTHTILQPAYFMESWLGPALGFDAVNARVRIYGAGQGRGSWISFIDVARFAVAALENPAARDATIALGGPEALSPLEVVEIFEEVSGRPFEVEHVPVEAIRAQQVQAQDPLEQSFAALMLAYDRGASVDMRETLKVFPLPLTSVRDYARRVLASDA